MYLSALSKRMHAVGAHDIETYIIKAYGFAQEALDSVLAMDDETRLQCSRALDSEHDLRAVAGPFFEAWVSAARLVNTPHYVEMATADLRYRLEKNNRPPKRIDSALELFDCITCDKCIPVCPNHANFRLRIDPIELAGRVVRWDGESFVEESLQLISLTKKHQIATFADFCNECGNCDVFCPEEGGPYEIKPLFFGNENDWREFSHQDGFWLPKSERGQTIFGRFDGREYRLSLGEVEVEFSGPGFVIEMATDGQEPHPVTVEKNVPIDLAYAEILALVRRSILDDLNYVSLLQTGPS